MKYHHCILFTLALAAAPVLRAETPTLQFGARPHASFKGVAGACIRAGNPSAAIDNGGPLCLILSAPRQETRSNRAFVSFNSSETQNTGLRPELTVEYTP
jgi:hypothetical protein